MGSLRGSWRLCSCSRWSSCLWRALPVVAVEAETIVGGAGARRAWLLATVALTLAALAGAVALGPGASAAPGRALAWLLFLGSSVHVAGTGWLYTLADVRGHA